MLRLTDDQIWREVREVAAEIGWNQRAEILRRAHLRLIERGAVGWDRLERLWRDRAEIVGPC